MSYFALYPPTQGRFIEEYQEGYYDDSWCKLIGDSSDLASATLRATKSKVKDIYWFMTGGGFDMAFNEATLNLIFSSVFEKIEVTEMSITHRGKKKLEMPEKVFHVKWLGDLIHVDVERLEVLRDREVKVGMSMSFVQEQIVLPGEVGQLDYFHSTFVVSENIVKNLVQEKVQQLLIFSLQRIPMDAGSSKIQAKNNINRLVEQGLSRNEAKMHAERVAKGELRMKALKKWRDGHYI